MPRLIEGPFRYERYDVSTSRDTAFAKIRAPVQGTELARQILGTR
ncbi:MAG: hypothetical protein ABIQ86_07305 [Steroidobacteraceae bacterium]